MEHKSAKSWTEMNVGLVITCFVAAALVVFGIITPAVQALVYHVEGRFIEATVVQTANHDRVEHELKENEKIEGAARWLDQGKGIVSIPIGQAMTMYIQRENSGSE